MSEWQVTERPNIREDLPMRILRALARDDMKAYAALRTQHRAGDAVYLLRRRGLVGYTHAPPHVYITEAGRAEVSA